MRQEQFNQIVNLLDTDVNFGISVYNLTNGVKPIEVSKTKEEIIAKYGSLENFFNGLFKNGVTEIGIQPRRKNGKNKGQTVQNWIDHPNYKYQKFSLNPTEAPVQQSVPTQPVMPMAAQPSLSGGLSLPEMISLHVDRNDKTRLETENRFLKEENDRLKKENWEHKESALERKYSSEKSSKNTEIVNTAISNIDKLAGLITAFKGQAIAPVAEIGLGNPNLSAQKKGLIDVIAQADDFTINLVTHLYNGIATDTALTPELTELLKKHNIIVE